ncbi:hypothetical protein SESBI_17396 [Sesbania bispinosa]|nr:hypothetical protein SESBI_17396 [Sesbania bispinosa]
MVIVVDGTSTLASKSKWKSSMPVSLDYGIKEGGSNNKGYAYTDINRGAEYYSDIMLKLRTFAEEDIIRESDCTTKRGE